MKKLKIHNNMGDQCYLAGMGIWPHNKKLCMKIYKHIIKFLDKDIDCLSKIDYKHYRVNVADKELVMVNPKYSIVLLQDTEILLKSQAGIE